MQKLCFKYLLQKQSFSRSKLKVFMAEPTHRVGPGVVGGGAHDGGVGGVQVRPSSKGITSCLKVCKSVTW